MARTRTQTQTQPESEFITSDDGVSFSRGNMMVDGVFQTPIEVKQWRSSNGITNHTTVMWQDPETGHKRTSCNCQGWAVKRKNKPRRVCKHTKDMEGLATCDAELMESTSIQTAQQAEASINEFDGRHFRGIDLDD